MTKFILYCMLSFAPFFALAQDKGPMKEPSKEHRAKMADRHTKMAECLKSDKPMSDCHKEMEENCKAAHNGKCPMMEKGGHHKHDMKTGKEKSPGKTE